MTRSLNVGISLIEVLIITAISAVTYSLAIPSISKLSTRFEADQASKRLKRSMVQARAAATNSAHTITLCPVTNNDCKGSWGGKLVAFNDLNGNRLLDNTEVAVFYVSSDDFKGKWKTRKNNEQYVKFYPNGFAFGSASTFLFCPESEEKNYGKQLVINFQGRPEIRPYLSESGAPASNLRELSCD